MLLMIFGPGDILIILVVLVVLFGGKKIPELAKGLGLGIRNFKGEMKSEDSSEESKEEKTPPK